MENTQQTTPIQNLLDNCTQMRIFLFEKQSGRNAGYKVYLFPNDPTQEALGDFKSNFSFYVSNRDIVDYSQTEVQKETIQKLSCTELQQWNDIKRLIDSVPLTDAPIFTADKVSKNIKMVVVECSGPDEIAPVYLISKFSHKTVYGRKVRYTYAGGTFVKLDNAVLTLGDCIDCFVYNDDVYILLESRFDSLFDFHKRIKDAVNDNIDIIQQWDFFDNNDIASDIIDKTRKSRQFLKVINSENLAIWKAKTPTERKALLQGDNKLKDKFQFDEDDRIVYSKETLNELFKLLTDDYFRSIITGETGER